MMEGRNTEAEAAAAAWYARLHAPNADVAADHATWLAADDTHRAAWRRVTQADAELDAARGSETIRAMVAKAHARAAAPRPPLWLYAAAAAIVLAVGGSSLIALRGQIDGPGQKPLATATEYRTAVGERRTITLADRSVLTLDTASRVRVALGGAERRIALEEGQAFFKVAKDKAHPFVVSARGNAVTALGTQFNVSLNADHFSVALIEGTVRVDTPAAGRATILHPGSMLVARGAGISVVSTQGQQATAWMDGRLRFDAVPLSFVVAEMNRYYPGRIVIADPALAREPISGTFRTDGVAAFVAALQETRIARADQRSSSQIVLRRF